MQSLKKIHAWAQMKVPLSIFTAAEQFHDDKHIFRGQLYSKFSFCPKLWKS